MFPIYLIKIRDKFTAFKFFPITSQNVRLNYWNFWEKILLKKINCWRWSENVDVTLPDSISSKEVEFENENILSINVDVLEILVGKNIRGKKS